jgi:uncharacterized protein YdeI (BOF family)
VGLLLKTLVLAGLFVLSSQSNALSSSPLQASQSALIEWQGLYTSGPVLNPIPASGAAPTPTRRIAQILANPVYDQRVVVRVRVTFHLEGNEYLVSDSSGQILADADHPHLYTLRLPIGAMVTMEAEVDIYRGRPELDILRVWLPNHTVIVIPRVVE